MAYNTSLGHSNIPTTYGPPTTLLPSNVGSRASSASLAWRPLRNGISASEGAPRQATYISVLPTKRSENDGPSGAGVVCGIMGLATPGPADVDFQTAVGLLLGMDDWDGDQREWIRSALLNWNKEAANSSTLHWDNFDDVTSATQQTRADLSLGHSNAKDFEQDVKHACGPDTSGASSSGTGMSYGAAAVAALALAGATFVK